MRSDLEKLDAIRAYLRSQPCLGFTFGDKTEKHPDFECIDAVPARTTHMCLRCRVLLYMDWTHGFPVPTAAFPGGSIRGAS